MNVNQSKTSGSDSAVEAVMKIHSALTSRGFFSQFVGSMIQYRDPKIPDVSLGLVFEENPYRSAGKHGQFRYKLINTTFVADDAVREKAQEHLNDLFAEGLTLEANFDVSDFKGIIAPSALKTMEDACRDGIVLREAFKVYLKAVHDVLNPVRISEIRTQDQAGKTQSAVKQNQKTQPNESKKSTKR
ncbi:hypothetical protein HY994_04035 [Candidatus Micrarchaeota archaeon]|nr:hypothetical protein [Candidatus Micrarchaeota archaeon]